MKAFLVILLTFCTRILVAQDTDPDILFRYSDTVMLKYRFEYLLPVENNEVLGITDTDRGSFVFFRFDSNMQVKSRDTVFCTLNRTSPGGSFSN